MTSVNEIFDLSKYEIQPYHIEVSDKNGNTCAHLNVNTKGDSRRVELNNLYKCNNSGTETLQKVIKYADSLRPHTYEVCLKDGSHINMCPFYDPENNKTTNKVNVPLALINILTEGQSWYNKYGFRSHNYMKEIENNKKVIESSFEDIINKITKEEFDSIVNNIHTAGKIEFISLSDLPELSKEDIINIFYNVIEDATGWSRDRIKNVTIQELFINLKKYILQHESKCNLNKKIFYNIEIILALANLLYSLIQYNTNLCLEFPEKAAAKTNNNQKRQGEKRSNTFDIPVATKAKISEEDKRSYPLAYATIAVGGRNKKHTKSKKKRSKRRRTNKQTNKKRKKFIFLHVNK